MNSELLVKWFLYNLFPLGAYLLAISFLMFLTSTITKELTIRHFRKFHLEEMTLREIEKRERRIEELERELRKERAENKKNTLILKAVSGALELNVEKN